MLVLRTYARIYRMKHVVKYIAQNMNHLTSPDIGSCVKYIGTCRVNNDFVYEFLNNRWSCVYDYSFKHLKILNFNAIRCMFKSELRCTSIPKLYSSKELRLQQARNREIRLLMQLKLHETSVSRTYCC